MKIVVCFASIVLVATLTEGLICLTCQNARNIEQCQRQGRIVHCRGNQKSCQTQIRSDPQGLRISKECKQREACINNKAQNNRPAWNPTQCSTIHGSVCTCCCYTDNCNFNSLFCPSRPTTTTIRPTTTEDPTPPPIVTTTNIKTTTEDPTATTPRPIVSTTNIRRMTTEVETTAMSTAPNIPNVVRTIGAK